MIEEYQEKCAYLWGLCRKSEIVLREVLAAYQGVGDLVGTGENMVPLIPKIELVIADITGPFIPSRPPPSTGGT